MLRKLIILMVINSFIFNQAGFAKKPEIKPVSSFDFGLFSDEIISAFNKSNGPCIDSLVSHIQNKRLSILNSLKSENYNEASEDSNFFMKEFYYTIFYHGLLHSTPLVNTERFIKKYESEKLDDGFILNELRKISWDRRVALSQIIVGISRKHMLETSEEISNKSIKEPLSLEQLPRVVIYEVNNYIKNYNSEKEHWRDPSSTHAVLIVAEPLVLWLLSQKSESVTHIDLFKQAVMLYDGDVFTALGVIGELFFDEVERISNRNLRAVLGSRMVPLFTNDKIDPIGYNYHFWGVLNNSLTQNIPVIDSIASRYIERNDPGDRAADQLGLDIGQHVLQSLRSQCYKKINTPIYGQPYDKKINHQY